MSQKIDVEEVKTINLKSGDVLAVKLPEDSSRAQVEAVRRSLNEVFKDNRVLVYSGNIEIAKITREDYEKFLN